MKQFFLIAVICLPLIGTAQVQENIDRGIVALNIQENEVYVGWRLLKDDPENISFNVYRKDIGLGDFVKEGVPDAKPSLSDGCGRCIYGVLQFSTGRVQMNN